ncbi:MAG TPA: DNA/RNA nuclease SfsA [Firmicutes bacterium]|nr:DNA/RNA nuclease SfsA [Bacillota bacterium]
MSRPNRFLATVRLDTHLETGEVGGVVAVHVADPGRLEELLVPGRLVYLASARTKSLGGFEAPAPDPVAPRPTAAGRHGPREPHGSRRKTSYDLALVDHEGLLVSVDSRVPNDLVFAGLQVGFFPDLALYSEVRRECAYGESRMDFRLSGSAAGDCLLEVKSVTLVRGGRALFPDAPTARGLRHVRELARAVAQGLRAIVVFVIQRDDAESLSPNDETDPAFGAGLREAVRSGVEVRAYTCRVALDRICLHREVPVLL